MKRFVLTRDMCPIHYVNRDGNDMSVAFICPLPLGFGEIVATVKAELLCYEIDAIVRAVNKKALAMEEPFQNILIEYSERKEEQQKDLLKGFQIQDIGIDHRGLYSVAVHGAYGDVYLDGSSMQNSEIIVQGFRKFFEPQTAWQCHNVDYYWQALLTREVVVDYFNLLMTLKERGTK
jgi:hypothetical protein